MNVVVVGVVVGVAAVTPPLLLTFVNVIGVALFGVIGIGVRGVTGAAAEEGVLGVEGGTPPTLLERGTYGVYVVCA